MAPPPPESNSLKWGHSVLPVPGKPRLEKNVSPLQQLPLYLSGCSLLIATRAIIIIVWSGRPGTCNL